MNNYATKFHIGQPVKITEGLYKGLKGRVKTYSPVLNIGMHHDFIARGIREQGTYSVRLSLLEFAEVAEDHLEAL